MTLEEERGGKCGTRTKEYRTICLGNVCYSLEYCARRVNPFLLSGFLRNSEFELPDIS